MVCHMSCPILQIQSKFEEVLHEISLTSTFDPQMLSFWVVMNINSVARGGSSCVLPHQVCLSYGQGAAMHKYGMC